MKRILAAVLLGCALLGACSRLEDSLEKTIAGVPLFIQGLVNAGALSQTKGDQIKADYVDLASAATTFSREIRAAGSDKVKKLQAAQTFERAWLEIYRRGHFLDVDPRVTAVVSITDELISAIVRYYGGTGAGVTPEARTRTVTGAPPTREHIKKLVDALERAVHQK